MSISFPRRTMVVAVVRERDGNHCFWCEKPLLRNPTKRERQKRPLPRDFPTLDHVIPRCERVSDGPENCVLACPRCNERRGNGDFVVFGIITIVQRLEAELRGEALWRKPA